MSLIETDDAARHRTEAQFEPAVLAETQISPLDGNLHLLVEAAPVGVFEQRPGGGGPGFPMGFAEDFVLLPSIVSEGGGVHLDDPDILVESDETVAQHVENAFGTLMD